MKPATELPGDSLASRLVDTVTLKDVALRTGLSTATISHVINGTRNVKIETRDRVLAAIKELGYSGHSVARSLRRGRTATLGLVVSDIENPFFTVLASHVQRAAALRGYQLIFANSEERIDREREILDALGGQRIDGLILAPVSQESATLLSNIRIPLVLVNRRFSNLESLYIIADDYVGASLGIDHLWGLGHRSIAIVHGDVARSTTIARVAGVRESYARRGALLDESLVIDASRSGDTSEAGLVTLLARKPRPTAVFALSNWALLAALKGLHRCLMRCPDDISLVGYGVTSHYWMLGSSISMVEQPVVQMAEAAVQLLLDRLEDVPSLKSTVLRPTFAPGQSSTAIPISGTERGYSAIRN